MEHVSSAKQIMLTHAFAGLETISNQELAVPPILYQSAHVVNTRLKLQRHMAFPPEFRHNGGCTRFTILPFFIHDPAHINASTSPCPPSHHPFITHSSHHRRVNNKHFTKPGPCLAFPSLILSLPVPSHPRLPEA
jgi:hypothetical protein